MTLGVFAYTLTIQGTAGFRAVDPDTEVPPASTATAVLSYQAGQPVINGSAAALFQTAAFVGPNRGERTGRARPQTDVSDFASQFEEQRIQVAQAREAEAEAKAEAEKTNAIAEERQAQRVAVASAENATSGADALRAIGRLTGDEDIDSSIPRPVNVPATLAYARANTPATDFTPKHDWDDRQQWCMATGIYFEARGESYRGQVAVAQVIMNRVAHDNYPDTICGVVYQNQHRRNACQFSFACDGIPDRITEPAAWAKAQEITQEVLNDRIYLTEVADATHYHATYVRPHWARNMVRLSQIGLHIFYRFKDGWQFG